MRAHGLIVTKDYGTGEAIIQARVVKEDVKHALELLDELRDKELSVEVKKWSNPRSLSANAYFHVLVGKIAEVQRLGMDEVKKRMVTEYGAIKRSDDGASVGFKLPESVNADEIYPYTKWFDTRTENGKAFHCYLVFKQTHTLDSMEMSRLIDGVVSEAKTLGIETMPPREIERMLSKWQ